MKSTSQSRSNRPQETAALIRDPTPHAHRPADADRRIARLLRPPEETQLSSAAPVHDDLVRRRFVADAPDRLWLTDITEHPTREGKVYLAAVLDVYRRHTSNGNLSPVDYERLFTAVADAA